MEDTLRVAKGPCYANNASVLILVLMEDTLRGICSCMVDQHIVGLNPCFNGRYSQSLLMIMLLLLRLKS